MQNSTDETKCDESEYEEMTMILELDGVLDAESVRAAAKTGSLALRNVSSGKPLVQLGNSLYSGEWSQTLGTDIILAPSSSDFQQLELVATSDTRLTSRKALLNSLNPTNAQSNSKQDAEGETHKDKSRPPAKPKTTARKGAKSQTPVPSKDVHNVRRDESQTTINT